MTLKTNRQQKSACPARNGQLPRRAIEAVRVARGRVGSGYRLCCRMHHGPRPHRVTRAMAHRDSMGDGRQRNGDVCATGTRSIPSFASDGARGSPPRPRGLDAHRPTHAPRSGRVKRARQGEAIARPEGVVFALVVTSPPLRLVVSRPPGRRACAAMVDEPAVDLLAVVRAPGGPAAPQGARQPPHPAEVRAHKTERVRGLRTQSGREDSNLRPLDPQSSALTRLRYAPGHCYREEIRSQCAAP